jgi:hypothetical protein
MGKRIQIVVASLNRRDAFKDDVYLICIYVCIYIYIYIYIYVLGIPRPSCRVLTLHGQP